MTTWIIIYFVLLFITTIAIGMSMKNAYEIDEEDDN